MKMITERFPNIKALVADDYPINLELIKEMLGLMECSADTAVDGEEVLALHNNHKYDVIFMDIQMPKIDGYDATRRIREAEIKGNRTIIIAITANALNGDREKCITAGMDDYISKPIRGEIVEQILCKYFKKGKE